MLLHLHAESFWAWLLASFHIFAFARLLSLPSIVIGANAALATPPDKTVNGTFMAGVWYTAWHDKFINMTNINFNNYTTVSYAFAETDPVAMVKLTSDDPNGEILTNLVKTAHAANSKVMLTVGGWTGSVYFSKLLQSPDTRGQFIQNVIQLAMTYDVDGLEFDWEFPAQLGIACNTISSDDTANYLTFLQELRGNVTANNKPWLLSAAVSDRPFIGSDGLRMTNVSAFADVLDYVSIMNYDIWTAVDGVLGPNAPLNDSCADASHQQGSAVSAMKAWSDAGFPKNKLVLGVPAYGRSALVDPSLAKGTNGANLSVFPAVVPGPQAQGDQWDLPGGTDPCNDTFASTGIWQWSNLMGAHMNAPAGLKLGTPYTSPIDPNTAKPKVAPEIMYEFDNCSQTPRVYNSTSKMMWSYDDLDSVKAKADFIKMNGLHGFALWEAAGDYPNQLLTDMMIYTLELPPDTP